MTDKKLISVVRAVFTFDNKYLVIEQENASGNKYLLFPGGHTKSEESLRDAVIRELGEELNIDDTKVQNIIFLKETLSPFDRDYEVFFTCTTSKEFSDIEIKQKEYTGHEKIGRCLLMSKEELVSNPFFYPKYFFAESNYQYIEMDVEEHKRLFGAAVHIDE